MAGREIGEEALERQFCGAECDEESNEKRR
jgi:hypothetical protein